MLKEIIMKHEKLLLCPDGMYVEEPAGRRRISARIGLVGFGQYEHSTTFVAIIRFDVGDTRVCLQSLNP